MHMHRIGARGNLTTGVKHQVHFDCQTLEFDGLHAASSHSTVCTSNRRIGRSALPLRSNIVMNLNAISQRMVAAARDSNQFNETNDASAFFAAITEGKVPTGFQQLCWQPSGKLRSITVRTAAKVEQKTAQTRCWRQRTLPRQRRRKLRSISAERSRPRPERLKEQ